MKRNTEIWKFLESIYIPVGKTTEHRLLLKLLQENEYRGIEDDDEGKSFPSSLIIETKGKGKYEAFQGYRITRIDIGEVSKAMVDIAICNDDCSSFTPMRVRKNNIRINILKEQ